MRVKTKRPGYLAVLTAATLLSGCKNYDFGSQAKQFVDNDSYEYSKRLVTADLDVRWKNFYHTVLVDLALHLAQVTQRIPNLRDAHAVWSREETASSSVQRLIFYDRNLPVVQSSRVLLEEATAAVRLARGACSNEQLFKDLGIPSLAVVAPLGSLNIPTRDLTIYIQVSSGNNSNSSNASGSSQGSSDPGFWASLIDSIRSLFNDSEWQRQKKMFDEALKDYPSKVVQIPEILLISTARCAAVRDRLKSEVDAAELAIQDYTTLFVTLERSFGDTRSTAEAILAPLAVETEARQSGLLAHFEQWRNRELQGRVIRELSVTVSELKDLEKSVRDAKRSCLERLVQLEEFDDLALELAGTVTALKPIFNEEGEFSQWVAHNVVREVSAVKALVDLKLRNEVLIQCAR